MLDIHVGERIRELREAQNYTREAFAEKICISAKFLYEIETGKKGFSADTLIKISTALSVSCDYILYGEYKEHYSNENVMRILENMKPSEICKIQKLLQKMCEIFNSI